MATSLAARLAHGSHIDDVRRWIAAHDQLLIRSAVIGAVFAGAALLGRDPSVLPLLGFAALGGVLLFYRWPLLGLLLTLIGGLGVVLYLTSGLNITMLGMALLIGIWLAEMLVLQRKFEVVDWPTLRAGLAFCLACTFSFLFGLLPWFPTSHAPLGAQLGGLSLVFLAVGSFAWAGNRIRSLRWLKIITFSFVAFSCLHLLGYLVPAAGRILSSRLFPTGSTGSMFWLWLTIIPFSQALYNRQLNGLTRTALLGVTAATMYVAFVVQNDWKSGWVPAAIGMGIVVALSSWRVTVMMLLAALLPAGAIAQRLIMSDAYSFSTRVEAWEILAQIVKVNPILGLGPANYYWYTPLFPIRGYFVSFNSHNQYVDLIAQFGFVGLLAFAWFAWEIGRVVWRMLRANLADDFARAYVISAAGGLVALLVAGFFGDWLFPFFYNVTMNGFRSAVLPWIFLGGLVAIEAMHLPSRRQIQEQGEKA